MSNDKYPFRSNASNNSLYDSITDEVKETISTTSAGHMADGTALLPGLEFELETNTGFYRPSGGNALNISVGGNNKLSVGASNVESKVPLYVADGLLTAPSLTFTNANTTGMYKTASDGIGFSALTPETLKIESLYVESSVPIRTSQGTKDNPSHTFAIDPNTGMYRLGADNIGFTCGGNDVVDISLSRINSSTIIRVPDGVAIQPSYGFKTVSDTGMYLPSSGELGFTVGNGKRLGITNSLITATTPIQVPDGSVSAPSYSFTNDSNTGMYSPTAGEIGFSVDGAKELSLTSSLTSVLNDNLVVGGVNTTTQKQIYFNNADSVGSGDSFLFARWTDSNTRAQIGFEFEYKARPTDDEVKDPPDDEKNHTNIYVIKNNYLQEINGTNSIRVLKISDQGAIYVADGSNSVPTYSFDSDEDTGIHWNSDGSFSMVSNTNNRMTIGTSNVSVDVPLVLQNGGTGLDHYEEGTHNTTWGSGLYASAITGNIKYTRAGDKITLQIPDILAVATTVATLNATTALPVGLRPAQTVQVIRRVLDNGTAQVGYLFITSTGTLTFYATVGGGSFSGAGPSNTGSFGTVITYLTS